VIAASRVSVQQVIVAAFRAVKTAALFFSIDVDILISPVDRFKKQAYSLLRR
jgi:hypothetical protein